MKNLFVGNLPFSATEEEVRNLFSQYGSVDSVEIISDRVTGLSRGFCFVRMDDADAEKAVEALNGQLFGGRRLQIKEAFPRIERPPRPERPFRRRFDDRDGGAGFDGERRPFRRHYDDRGGGNFDGERRPFRRRYDDRDGGKFDGERRPFRRRYDDRDGGNFDGERRPFRRHYDDRDGGAGFDGERRPFRRRYDDRGGGGFDGKRRSFRRYSADRDKGSAPETPPRREEEGNGEK